MASLGGGDVRTLFSADLGISFIHIMLLCSYTMAAFVIELHMHTLSCSDWLVMNVVDGMFVQSQQRIF